MFRLRGWIFGAELDLLKGLISEHGIEVEDLEAVTRPKAVQLVDTWFQHEVESPDKGVSAITSVKFTFLGEEKPKATSPSPVIEAPSVKPTIDPTAPTDTKSFSIYKKEFKISGQIDCRTGISYMSLKRQIDSGLKKGHSENDIVDTIIKSIPPTSNIRKYLEGNSKLDLKTTLNILRAHYNEKSATELFGDLGQITQEPKELATDFLMRALDLRQKVIFASKESSDDLKYSPELVLGLFNRTVFTGLSNTTIRQEFKPFLESADIRDEDMIDALNKIVSRETERMSKFNKCKVNELTEVKSKERLEIQQLRAEISELRQTMERTSTSSDPDNKKFRGREKRCEKCVAEGNQKCMHCCRCGSSEHFRRGCRNSGNAKRPHQGGEV